MKLTPEQLQTLERDGFLLVPRLFSEAEVQVLRDETARLVKVDADYTVKERGGDVRALFRVHEDYGPTQSAEFRALSRTPRLMESACQALGDDKVYVFHTKVNVKPGITGGIWSWHQDFGRWQTDGVPTPNVYTWLVMLDEAEEINGCLYMVPGSHKGRVVEHVDDPGLGALNSYAVHRDVVKSILRRSPKPVPLIGPPGTCVLFHADILHASGHNLSANDRRQAYVVYNPVANKPHVLEKPRPDHVCSTNVAPISMGADDGVIRAAEARRRVKATT